MYQSAREYLARVVAWPQPGDAEAFVNIHWSVRDRRPENKTGKYWTGRPAASLDEAVKHVQWAMSRPDTLDVYACQSTQSMFTTKTNARGFEYRVANRSAQTAVRMKGIFIDSDMKLSYDKNGVLLPKEQQKGYPDEAALNAALVDFCVATGLPRPTMVVHTGGGKHIYWLVEGGMDIAQWEVLAFALAEATKKLGFHCDTQCTVDAARILRVPDTFNRKSEPHRPVTFDGKRLDFDYKYDTLLKALEPYKVALPSRSTPATMALFPARAPVADDLSGGIDTEKFDPVNLDDVLPECPFLADAVATGGKDHSNPLWNLTTLISTFCVDGRKQAHRMGDQHADYTKENQDAFYDRKATEAVERGLGWPSCRTISASGARHCGNCPHLGQGKSPLHFRTAQKYAQHGNLHVVAAGQAQGTGAGTGAPGAGSGQGAQSDQGGQGGVATLTAPPPVPSGFGPAAVAGAQAPAAGNAPQQVAHSLGHAALQADLPPGYSRSSAGIISRAVLTEDGSTVWVPLCEYPMTAPWLQRDPRMLHFNSIVDRGMVTQISIELEHINTNEMRKILQVQGFMLPPKHNYIVEFLLSWIKKLQETAEAVSSAPFGWHYKNGKTEGFVYGNQLWTPSGSKPSASADGVIARQYAPKGDVQYWLDAVKLVTSQGRPDLDAIIASAFAAPLVAFTGQPGVLMSAYSQESGIGKSTALRIAQAVWGDPLRAVQSLNDTQNSVMGKIGEIRSLPLYWDELKTEEDTKKFVNITFQVTQGKEKSRMTQHAKQREPGSWQTLIVSASNDSLLNYVTEFTSTTTAGLYRVFEYVVKPAKVGAPGQISPSDASILLAKLNNNFGQIGLQYAQFLGENHVRIEAEMRQYLETLGTETHTTQDERFWMALIAAICMGARYANELGVCHFNEIRLKLFMLTVLDKMRAERKSQPIDMAKDINVSTILQRFLSSQRQKNTLITNRIHIGRGKPAMGSIKVLNPDPNRLEGINVHIGIDDKLVRISSLVLSEWLSAKKISRHIFKTALEREFGMKPVNGRIGGGTPYAGATEYLLEIDLGGSTVLNFIDEE